MQPRQAPAAPPVRQPLQPPAHPTTPSCHTAPHLEPAACQPAWAPARAAQQQTRQHPRTRQAWRQVCRSFIVDKRRRIVPQPHVDVGAVKPGGKLLGVQLHPGGGPGHPARYQTASVCACGCLGGVCVRPLEASRQASHCPGFWVIQSGTACTARATCLDGSVAVCRRRLPQRCCAGGFAASCRRHAQRLLGNGAVQVGHGRLQEQGSTCCLDDPGCTLAWPLLHLSATAECTRTAWMGEWLQRCIRHWHARVCAGRPP